MMFYHW